MLDTIENILNGNQYPLLRANRQEAYVYRQFLQDTPSVAPNYSPLYKVEFRHIAHHPYKVRYYFRLINNDIYTHLNQFFAQYSEQNKLQIPYHHRQIRSVIEEYISHFYEKLQQQPASDDLLTAPPTSLSEAQMFTIICYYAIASLACAYMQYGLHFRQYLPKDFQWQTPQDFIYDVLQCEFPKEILIHDLNAPQDTAPQPTSNFHFHGNVGQVIGNANQINNHYDEQR